MLKNLSASSLLLLVLTACSAPPQDGIEPGNPDAGIDVGEGEGEANEGEGEPNEGEGEPGEGEGEPAEGEGEPAEGEGEPGEGEGEGGTLVGDLYVGEAEEGVVCNAETCDIGGACCLDLASGAASCNTTPVCNGGFTTVPLVCDGPEDCNADTPICCASFGGASCVADGACTGGFNFETCTDDTSCAVGSNCCSSDQLSMVGIDAGVCVAPNAAGDRCVIQGAP
jgi:hypothetical protein